jgi:hypothetical protein
MEERPDKENRRRGKELEEVILRAVWYKLQNVDYIHFTAEIAKA